PFLLFSYSSNFILCYLNSTSHNNSHNNQKNHQEFINDKVFDKFQLKDKHVIVLPNQLGTRVNLLFNKLI
ncbi:MAG: hypothetical protein Q8883_02650, partial [Sweet potato little leaf phytoplasma]|nr:hypothetical protein [Sweet potato little leaf phytoplasma]